MNAIEILLSVVFALAVGTGVNLTTAGTNTAEFFIARICYFIAGGALLAAYLVWVYTGEREPSWRVLLGVLVGVLVVVGTTETILWVNTRERAFFTQQALQLNKEAVEVGPIVQALRDAQQQLGEKTDAQKVANQIIAQYDKLESATDIFEKRTNSPELKERLSSAQHTIANLKALLSGVRVAATNRGRGLFIKTASNTFRITFPVPMRIAPNIEFQRLPNGAEAKIVDKSNVGFTVVFTPLTTSVEVYDFDFSASADL